MGKNEKFGKAKLAKNNEFYTQLSDIEAEMYHYTHFFKNKTVFCNCDDPFESNFFYYFATRFNDLGLKKLICTCYYDSIISNTEMKTNFSHTAYKIIITEVNDANNDGVVDIADVEYLLKDNKNSLVELEGNGDFRSDECLALLQEADIVVTNPPYSLFKEYIPLLIKYEKKFIVMGPMNACHYKEIFPLIKDNKIWSGYGFNKTMVFRVPDYYEGYIENGIKYGKVPGICWYTNLEIPKRNDELPLYKTYSESEYPHYTNFDAIDVKNVKQIPVDYYGMMGVPDSFLEHFNPEQFELIGLGAGNLAKEIGVSKNYRGRTDISYIENGKHKCPYSRIIIRRKTK